MIAVAFAACSTAAGPPPRPEPGVIYTFPADGELDVPIGARVVVTFSDPVVAGAIVPCSGTASDPVGALCIVGPGGPIAATAEVVGDGTIVQLTSDAFAEGTTYAVYARSPLAPSAQNLPTTGPLFRFTTRSTRPRAAAPALIAINGAAPDEPGAGDAMFESSTIRLVFSQPLDPRTVVLAPGAIELVETASGAAVPAVLFGDGIHVSIDPRSDLVAGAAYELRIGAQLSDLGGRTVAPRSIAIVPHRSLVDRAIPQVLRTRASGDHGPTGFRAGADRNVIAIESPLIGSQSARVLPSALEAELGDPVLGGPLPFTIRRGQRLRASGLDVKLGGVIPAGLSTGDIVIELISDGGGVIHRNPHQPTAQRPDNDRSPLIADLSLDLAVYATDPAGNAVLTQTVLGVRGSGVVTATDGVLDIEAVIAIDLDLLGVARASANLVLELITDPAAAAAADTSALVLRAALPGGTADPASLDTAVELVFSEPIDLGRAQTGVRLETSDGQVVPSALDQHGAALAIRPLAPLAPGTSYRVALIDVVDLAGNALAATDPPSFSIPVRPATAAPLSVASVHPGAPCALAGGGPTSPGHCLTSTSLDDNYPLFSLAANDAVDVRFTQAPARASLTLGAACNTGSVRIEEVDGGTCTRPVAGTLRVRDRALSFVPDTPWQVGGHYRLTLVSGSDGTCEAGEICGVNGLPASFSTLDRGAMGVLRRSDLVIDFTGAAASRGTLAIVETAPLGDVNGSGTVEPDEPASDANRSALRITGVTGVVTGASFPVPDCIADTAEGEACIAVFAALPVELLPLAHDCPVPGGAIAQSCIPVDLSPEIVHATSIPLNATAVLGSANVTLDLNTGGLVLRVRVPPGGPLRGYIIDDGGTPVLVASLDLYLDAPALRIPPLTHDLHAKPLSVILRGPLRFLPDGRIAIAVANTNEVPLAVNIEATEVAGSVQMVVPSGGLKLQLVSPPLRGGPR